MSMGAPRQTRRFGARNQKLRAPRSHGLGVPIEDMWERLSVAITHIQHHNISKLSYEEHYRYAYNLILNQQGDMLYAGVRRQVTDHLIKQSDELLVPLFPLDAPTALAAEDAYKGKGKQENFIASVLCLLPESEQTGAILATIPANERFLNAVTSVWEDHCSCMGKLRDVLKYVDRVYVTNENELPIWELGMELFRDTIVRSTRVLFAPNLMVTLLRQIYCEREGASVERRSLKSVSDMLLALTQPGAQARSTVYQKDFEPLLLETTSEYYCAEAARLLAAGQATCYLQQAERRFAEEETRVHACLSAGTLAPLRAALERNLLTDHLEEVLAMADGGLVALLESDRRDDLERMYRLFSMVQTGLFALNKALRTYATIKGQAINDAARFPAESGPGATAELAMHWVSQVLQFKTRFDTVLYTSFRGDKSCGAAINEAFDSFVNMNPRAPEYISLFIHEHLKKGAKVTSDAGIEQVLDSTIAIFRFVHEKDMFERYYKLHLTQRLLHGRSVSDDVERGMIGKLKVECGHGYVQKLQGMLNDMKLSEEVLAAFHQRQAAHLAFQLNVHVLTATYWPIAAPQAPVFFSPLLRNACAAFEQFYAQRHRGRVLTWQPNLGSADVKVRFRARTHELVVSTFALVVLLLFEEEETLGYKTIRESTNIGDTDLQRTLQSLACAKYKILHKVPKGRTIHEDDTFHFNADFTAPLARIKIAQVAAKVETPTERKETAAKVEEERKSQVEACIVRVMKNRKTLSHNDLVNEVVRQLLPRFQPTPALIKKRIESLLEREFLEARTSLL